jgi:hypothetical protein
MTRVNRPDQQSWVTELLDDVCASGFCLSPAERAHLEADPPRNVDAFTAAILISEGLDPTLVHKDVRLVVRARVAQHVVTAVSTSLMPQLTN